MTNECNFRKCNSNRINILFNGVWINLQSKRMNNSKKPGFLPLPFSFPFFLLDASPVAVALHFFPLLGGKVCVQAEEFGGMVALG